MPDKIKVLSRIVLLLTIMCMLTSCAGTNKSPNDGKLSINPENEKKHVKLEFTFWGSNNEKLVISNACKRFSEKYPWITVECTHITNPDYTAKMVALDAAGSLPDTGYLLNEIGETWASQGKLQNLYEMLDKDEELKRSDFFDYTWFLSSPDNAWGISTAPESYALYYNKPAFKEAGLEAPPATAEKAWTWDQFVAAAKKLTFDKNGKNASEAGFDPDNIEQYGVMFETWDVPLTCFIASNGGQWVSDDGKKFMLNSPEAVEAIQKLADLVNVYHVAPSPLAVKSLPTLDVALNSRIAAMVIGGHWMNLDLGAVKADYDIGVLPKLKKNVTVVCSAATVIYKNSQNPSEAWLLFKWLSNPENCIELYTDGLWMPQMKKWYTDSALLSKWVDANPAAHPPGFRTAVVDPFLTNPVPQVGYYLKNQSKIITPVISGLDQVWLGKERAADALKSIEKKVQPEIQGRNDKN
jgi:multiple sugar transport system substrate-binding protein